MKNICGCGECHECQQITQNIIKNQTYKEKEYDSYVTRLKGSDNIDFQSEETEE